MKASLCRTSLCGPSWRQLLSMTGGCFCDENVPADGHIADGQTDDGETDLFFIVSESHDGEDEVDQVQDGRDDLGPML